MFRQVVDSLHGRSDNRKSRIQGDVRKDLNPRSQFSNGGRPRDQQDRKSLHDPTDNSRDPEV